jgi:hypothetical protein
MEGRVTEDSRNPDDLDLRRSCQQQDGEAVVRIGGPGVAARSIHVYPETMRHPDNGTASNDR